MIIPCTRASASRPIKIEATALSRPGLRHGFFTRRGGVSDGLYASLNIGLGSQDDPAHVAENRGRVADAMEVARDCLVTPWQYHSAVALTVERPLPPDERPKADAVVTRQPGIALGVSTADCAPVLLADPDAAVIGAAHAGWRGALAGIVEATVAAMLDLGAVRERIIAVIGPTICQRNYEVGEDFRRTFLDADPDNDQYFAKPHPTARPHFDLPGYVGGRLARAGIGEVADLRLCTYGHEEDFFSFRRATHRAEPDYGRLISSIAIMDR
jgi:YfiH family protein